MLERLAVHASVIKICGFGVTMSRRSHFPGSSTGSNNFVNKPYPITDNIQSPAKRKNISNRLIILVVDIFSCSYCFSPQ